MNLTDEQLLAASKAMFAANPQSMQWRDIGSCEKQIYLSHALAAAPLLQMWWIPPSEEEITQAQHDRQESGFLAHERAMRFVLSRFVNRRNASLIPKPVDPRREKVIDAVRQKRYGETPE